MNAWWSALDPLNRFFYCAAAFFSVFFLWQLITALLGIGGDDGGDDGGHDMSHDVDDVGGANDTGHDGSHAADAGDSVAAFQLLSIRSIITFCTLFTWGTAMYLNRGDSLVSAMGVSSLWGLAGMVSVSLLVYLLLKMVHTGTKNLNSCVGSDGSVYLDIPEKGVGEVRVMVTGTMSHVRARSVDGRALKAGTPIQVTRRLDQTSVEVKAK